MTKIKNYAEVSGDMHILRLIFFIHCVRIKTQILYVYKTPTFMLYQCLGNDRLFLSVKRGKEDTYFFNGIAIPKERAIEILDNARLKEVLPPLGKNIVLDDHLVNTNMWKKISTCTLF
ncbi:MAG: hypothetical protein EAY65_04710 [Alphaproteobacteria bacterium]|nr:MAG: hypothetical protein EAY65_04710 [Alphaproteobacteria bacterium]